MVRFDTDCQLGKLLRLWFSCTILLGQNANRHINTMAAGKTVKATMSIIVTVIANIGPIVLKAPSIENTSRNIATTVVIAEPIIDGPTLRMAKVIA